MSANIAEVYWKYKNAEALFEATLKELQAECLHERVVGRKGMYLELLDTQRPGERFCMDCLLQERSTSAWTPQYAALNREFVMAVAESQFYELYEDSRRKLFEVAE